MYGKSIKNEYNTHEVWPGFSNSMLHSYRVESKLGPGGSGAVYKAWHKRLRKYLVIKEQKDKEIRAIESHRNEIEALKNIKSLYLPQVFDFHMEDSASFTVMEYIDGDSFDKLLKDGKMFTEAEIIKWYYQIACALQTIHKHEVCHRDIKPSNIMLMYDGNVCLIDFNAAHVNGNLTGMVNRSPGYASPEQHMYFQLCEDFNNKRELFVAESQRKYVKTTPIDWKLSDIYSLGATIYHLLTGKRPPAPADEKTISVYLEDYLDYNLAEVAKIVKRSMQINPKDRYSSASELCKALSELM